MILDLFSANLDCNLSDGCSLGFIEWLSVHWRHRVDTVYHWYFPLICHAHGLHLRADVRCWFGPTSSSFACSGSIQRTFQGTETEKCKMHQNATVDGSLKSGNSPVEVGSLSQIFTGFFYTSQVVIVCPISAINSIKLCWFTLPVFQAGDPENQLPVWGTCLGFEWLASSPRGKKNPATSHHVWFIFSHFDPRLQPHHHQVWSLVSGWEFFFVGWDGWVHFWSVFESGPSRAWSWLLWFLCQSYFCWRAENVNLPLHFSHQPQL